MEATDEKIERQAGDAWEASRRHFRNPAVLLATVALTTAVLYSGTLSFGFVWDDKAQIVDNPLIRSLSKLHKVFVSDLWYHTGRFQLYYRPLFVVWSMLNYAVLGLRPWGWHLTAVLVHIAAVLAVFLLVRKLGVEYWTAALATLLFAVHPIHIECVAWISAVSDSMATMFGALSFVAFLQADDPGRKHSWLWRTASLVLLACALLTKEIALGFFVLIALYVWIFPPENCACIWRRARNAAAAALPYAMVTVGYLLLRKYALSEVTGTFDPHHTAGDIFLTLPYTLTFYLRQLLLPIGLTGLYFFPYISVQQVGRILLPIVILTGFVALLYVWSRKKKDPLVLFAGLWMAIGLAPALYLRAFTEGDFVRDRYIYFGSIGFVILAAKAIRLIPSFGNWSATGIQGAFVTVLCLTYVGVSLAQQGYWDSDLLIYARGYKLYPQNPYTEVGLAREYSQLGAYDHAIPLVEDAFRRRPDYLYGAYALADVYIASGRNEQGRAALEYALHLMPEYARSDTGEAAVAAMWGKLGEYDRALEMCSRVLARDPDLFSAVYNCGNIEMMAKKYSAAETLLRQATLLSPELAAPKHFLGRTLYLDGKNAEAQPLLRQAAAIDPTFWDYHYWLGLSLEESGKLPEARAEYEQARYLNPDSSEVKLRLTALEAK
jgi:protein O-mannosyl-transferase